MRVAAAAWSAFACLILAMIASGAISRYVQAFWRLPLAVACVLVIAACGYLLWRGRGGRAARIEAGQAPSRRLAALAIVPTALVVLASPSPLGSAMLTATQRVVVVAEPTRTQPVTPEGAGYVEFAPLSPTRPTRIGLDELAERLQNGDPARLAGKPVTFVGFTSAPTQAGGGLLAVNRFKIYCCAADAIAYTALVRTDQTYPADTWLRVTGTVDVTGGADQLVVVPTRIQRIAAPGVPYL